MGYIIILCLMSLGFPLGIFVTFYIIGSYFLEIAGAYVAYVLVVIKQLPEFLGVVVALPVMGAGPIVLFMIWVAGNFALLYLFKAVVSMIGRGLIDRK